MAPTTVEIQETFLVAVKHGGSNWALEVQAETPDEARRLAHSLNWPHAQQLIVAQMPEVMATRRVSLRKGLRRNWHRFLEYMWLRPHATE